MLPKRSRIPRELFGELLKSSKYYNSEHFTLRYRAGVADPRFGVSVSKKVSKKAVLRNAIRRRTYAVLYPVSQKVTNGLYLFVAKPGSEKIRGEILRDEILGLFNKTQALSL